MYSNAHIEKRIKKGASIGLIKDVNNDNSNEEDDF